MNNFLDRNSQISDIPDLKDCKRGNYARKGVIVQSFKYRIFLI